MSALLALLGQWAMAICYFFMVFSALAMIVLTFIVIAAVAASCAFSSDVQ